MKNFIFLWSITTFRQVQSFTKNYMTYEAPLDREICLMGFYCIYELYFKVLCVEVSDMGRGKQRRKYKQKQKRIEKAKSGKPS